LQEKLARKKLGLRLTPMKHKSSKHPSLLCTAAEAGRPR
jgi:hypothetical protein